MLAQVEPKNATNSTWPPKPPVPGFVSTANATGVAPAFIKGTAPAGDDGKEAMIDAGESNMFLDERTEAA